MVAESDITSMDTKAEPVVALRFWILRKPHYVTATYEVRRAWSAFWRLLLLKHIML